MQYWTFSEKHLNIRDNLMVLVAAFSEHYTLHSKSSPATCLVGGAGDGLGLGRGGGHQPAGLGRLLRRLPAPGLELPTDPREVLQCPKKASPNTCKTRRSVDSSNQDYIRLFCHCRPAPTQDPAQTLFEQN